MIWSLLILSGIFFFFMWQCFNHSSNISFVVLQNKTEDSSHGERRCRKWLESYFGRPFIKIRPEWLKNPVYGRNLELDCYNEELGLAVEYNGKQHYSYVSKFHKKGKKDLQYSKWKDALKHKLCNEHGVYLIIVPYTHFYDIEKFLEQQIIEWKTSVHQSANY